MRNEQLVDISYTYPSAKVTMGQSVAGWRPGSDAMDHTAYFCWPGAAPRWPARDVRGVLPSCTRTPVEGSALKTAS